MAEMNEPDSGQQQSGLKKIQDSLNNVNVQDLAGKAREYARSNPAKVLGGLSALVIGAGLLAKRGRQ